MGAPSKTDRNANATDAPRKRKSVLQKCLSPIVFLCFVAASAVVLNTVANGGYFEKYMDDVRAVATEKYMERRRVMPNASVLPSGLVFSIERRGSGDRAPAAGDACDIHYRAGFRFPVVFDDTHQRSYPPRLAPSQFIPGVSEALQLMREGDMWSLVVPYQLAYGMTGNATLGIPSRVNLKYELELVKCPGPLNGRTSEEIDSYLAPYLKTPMPAKAEAASQDL